MYPCLTELTICSAHLRVAETRLKAFENTDIGEVERKERLFVANKQLERYKAMFGETSTLPPDSKAMAEQLKRKEAELENLRLQQKQQEQVCIVREMGTITKTRHHPRLSSPCTLSWRGCLRHGNHSTGS